MAFCSSCQKPVERPGFVTCGDSYCQELNFHRHLAKHGRFKAERTLAAENVRRIEVIIEKRHEQSRGF